MNDKASYPLIERIVELQQLVAEFSEILRAVPLMKTGRKENDVDHSFGLALTCWFLAPKIAPHLDLSKILRYALAHDIVELYAGDMFAFSDQSLLATKSDREDAALAQIAEDWPDFPELAQYAKDYKEKIDAEAKFVYSIDKILPVVMVKTGEDESFWKRHKITKEMHEAEKRKKMRHSPEVLPYLDMLNEWAANPDNFYKPDKRS